jgi:hypothetical protein
MPRCGEWGKRHVRQLLGRRVLKWVIGTFDGGATCTITPRGRTGVVAKAGRRRLVRTLQCWFGQLESTSGLRPHPSSSTSADRRPSQLGFQHAPDLDWPPFCALGFGPIRTSILIREASIIVLYFLFLTSLLYSDMYLTYTILHTYAYKNQGLQ